MSFINNIKEKARQNKKRIVLPESMDERVIEAAKIAASENLAEVILIAEEAPNIEGVTVVSPSKNPLTEEMINGLFELRKEKGMTIEEARELLLTDYMYYACMLVKLGYADGVVSGACHSTSDTLRPSLQIIKTNPGTKLVSSFFIMVVPNCEYGDNGTFVFSDCGLVQKPNAEELSAIAVSSAESYKKLIGKEPIVALLSHSSKGSAQHPDVDKVVEALNIVKAESPEIKIDGELQLDAAIIPEIGNSKAPESEVAGRANVLVFPDLDSGNIGYKLVERLAKAEAYGPLTQGIAAPINDLSRGCSVNDIVGVIAITAVQAME